MPESLFNKVFEIVCCLALVTNISLVIRVKQDPKN